MLYIEYQDYKNKYIEAQKKYDEKLSHKEKLFLKTQPKTTTFDKERVSGGQIVNAFEQYLIEKEEKRIDELLEEIKSILSDRERLLMIKEKELRCSKDWHDKIYTYYFIDKLSTYKIEKRVPYSQKQIWNIVSQIKKSLLKIT